MEKDYVCNILERSYQTALGVIKVILTFTSIFYSKIILKKNKRRNLATFNNKNEFTLILFLICQVGYKQVPFI